MSEQSDLIPGELGGIQSDTGVAIRAGQALAPLRPIEDDKRFSVIVPEGSEHKVIDPDHAPRRKRGTVKVDTAAAFELYVDRHRIEDRTTVWVPGDAESNLLTAPRIEAVIDDHRHNNDGGDPEYGNAGFGSHRAHLQLRLTAAWKHWIGRDKTQGTQEEFAQHIEDGLGEIVEPDGATMLEIAQTFLAASDREVSSAVRLTSGELDVRYAENISARARDAAGNELKVPTEFVLGLSPFVGEDPFRITARLRYRLRETRLSIGYQLVRPDDVVRASLSGIFDRLREHYGEGVVFLGTPDSGGR